MRKNILKRIFQKLNDPVSKKQPGKSMLEKGAQLFEAEETHRTRSDHHDDDFDGNRDGYFDNYYILSNVKIMIMSC